MLFSRAHRVLTSLYAYWTEMLMKLVVKLVNLAGTKAKLLKGI